MTASDGSGSAGSSARDKVEYVNQALYARLEAAAVQSRSRIQRGELRDGGLAEIEAFLVWEARLLDFGHYRAWLDLLADDCIYWVPSDTQNPDPRGEAAVNFDDRRRLIDRIALIETGEQIAQTPPSRTCRVVTNIEGWPTEDGMETRSNVVIWEHRRGRTNTSAGWQTHHLIKAEDRWLIQWKVVNLINSDQPQANITFIL